VAAVSGHAIAVHEGRTVLSRSPSSILAEAEQLTRHPQFKGIIHDLCVAGDDPAAEYLAGHRSLAAIPHYDRGLAYMRKGNFDQAIADFTKAIELDPQGPYGVQAKDGLDALQAMGVGINTRVNQRPANNNNNRQQQQPRR